MVPEEHARIVACLMTSSGAPPEHSEGAQPTCAYSGCGVHCTHVSAFAVSCPTVKTNGVAHPLENESVVYHFPMHPRAVITADRTQRKHMLQCVRPDWDTQPGTITDYHWGKSRQDLRHLLVTKTSRSPIAWPPEWLVVKSPAHKFASRFSSTRY